MTFRKLPTGIKEARYDYTKRQHRVQNQDRRRHRPRHGLSAEAIRKVEASLCELVIEGVPTNCDLQLEILSDPRFEAGDYYTDFMEGL